ncbi:MAG: dual specificity protein phosphatase family protein [Planctomycetes bacterium]|nr:dual specificity protein phosphatase family protein [Planctomycetota bacterium]
MTTSTATLSSATADAGPAPKRRRRVWRIAALTLLAAIAAMALYYAKWEYVDHRFVTISADRVYQSAAMPAPTIVATMRDHGIKTVLDLRDVDQELIDAEATAVGEAGLTHVHLPMPLDPDANDVQAFLAAMDHADKPVLVHCKHGQGRSVLMCAIYRIEEEGWSNAAAFDATARLPEGLAFLHTLIPPLFRFRADSAKGSLLLAYRPTRQPPK